MNCRFWRRKAVRVPFLLQNLQEIHWSCWQLKKYNESKNINTGIKSLHWFSKDAIKIAIFLWIFTCRFSRTVQLFVFYSSKSSQLQKLLPQYFPAEQHSSELWMYNRRRCFFFFSEKSLKSHLNRKGGAWFKEDIHYLTQNDPVCCHLKFWPSSEQLCISHSGQKKQNENQKKICILSHSTLSAVYKMCWMFSLFYGNFSWCSGGAVDHWSKVVGWIPMLPIPVFFGNTLNPKFTPGGYRLMAVVEQPSVCECVRMAVSICLLPFLFGIFS